MRFHGEKKIFGTEMKDEKDWGRVNGEEYAKEEAQCEPRLRSQGEGLGAKSRGKNVLRKLFDGNGRVTQILQGEVNSDSMLELFL